MTRTRWLGLIGGLVVFCTMLLLPAPAGMELTAWHVAVLTLLMAIWWMTEALPLTVTALLPFLTVPAFGVMDANAIAKEYYSPILFLILGGAFLALAIERVGLHRRLALALLKRASPTASGLLFAFMAATAMLSMFISNTSTTLIMIPIALAVVPVLWFAGVLEFWHVIVIGTVMGSLAGYFGRWVDQLLMRVTDLFLIVPAIAVLAIALQRFGTSDSVIIFTLAGLFWMQISRVVRGQVLAVKEKEFVDAARAAGASSFRIITRHVLPNCIGPIVVNATLAVAFAIVAESTLSFLGFGVQKPQTSWGNLLFDAKGNVQFDTHLLYFPGLFILLTVLCINFVGDGLRDALDPQSGRD